MNDIKNIILCGMGAIGSIYADKILKYDELNFRVLVDEARYSKYVSSPVIYNSKKLDVKYILPNESDFSADLIIIATKMSGFEDALSEIKNFVSDNTIILPLLNGVLSEELVASFYGRNKVLYSYFIGHSSVRIGNRISHDGVNTIVFGSDNPNDADSIQRVKAFFDYTKINYEVPQDIRHSLWGKFMLNVSSNTTTALFRKTFGEMLSNERFMEFAKKIMKEVQLVAEAEGIKNSENLVDETLSNLQKMTPEGKTSMLQDVEAGRLTENEIFTGAVLELAKRHGIQTPYCKFLKECFDIIDYR